MFLRIEKSSSVPISRQILEQIRAQCLAGTLRVGEKLPSVRDLARELAVNVNTIFRVYEKLSAEQLIELRHGEGTFVRQPPPRSEGAKQLKSQRDKFGVEFDALIRRGMLLGITPRDFHRLLEGSLKLAQEGIDSEDLQPSR